MPLKFNHALSNRIEPNELNSDQLKETQSILSSPTQPCLELIIQVIRQSLSKAAAKYMYLPAKVGYITSPMSEFF